MCEHSHRLPSHIHTEVSSREDAGGPKAGQGAGAAEGWAQRKDAVLRLASPQGLQDLRLSIIPLSFSLLAWKKANNAHLKDVHKYEITT